MPRPSAPSRAPLARSLLLAAACLALPHLTLPCVALGDLVYVASKTTGGLYRFDSSNPAVITTVFGSNTFNQPSALAMGDDGNLYIGESPEAGDGDPRILRYEIGSGSFSEVVNLSGTAAGYTGEAIYPAALAFRRAADGGEMLVGRNPASPNPYGPVMAVSGWKTPSPSVTTFTSGSLNASPGLAVSPATGRLYVSDAIYLGVNQPIIGSIAEFNATQNPAPYVQTFTSGTLSGPIGLVAEGFMVYSANAIDGIVFATNVTTGSSTPIGTAAFAYDIGTLARLSDGDLLAGSLLGFSGQVYRVSTTGGGATPLYGFGASPFGQIGGLAVIFVPEPTALAIAGCGLAAVAARCRRRRTVA